MSNSTVVLTYGIAALLALSLLYLFRARRWYWHVGSVVVAFLIGIIAPPEGWASQRYDLAIGSIFFFLCLWGLAGVFFRPPHDIPGHG